MTEHEVKELVKLADKELTRGIDDLEFAASFFNIARAAANGALSKLYNDNELLSPYLKRESINLISDLSTMFEYLHTHLTRTNGEMKENYLPIHRFAIED